MTDQLLRKCDRRTGMPARLQATPRERWIDLMLKRSGPFPQRRHPRDVKALRLRFAERLLDLFRVHRRGDVALLSLTADSRSRRCSRP